MRVIARTVAASLPIGLCLSLAGCGAEPAGGVLGSPPSGQVLHLSELAAEILAPERTELASQAPLLSLDRDALAGWARRRSGTELRFESPALSARGLSGVGTLRLRLAPGGATRLSIVPHPREARVAREDRALRRLDLSLERDAHPDRPVELAVDLHEALHANLGDAGRTGRLERIELILPGADPERVVLHALVVERRSPLGPGVPAAADRIDHGGVLRPTWAIRGGVAVEIPLLLPEGAPELRWSAGAVGGTGARSIEIVDAGQAHVVAREAPVSSRIGEPWQPRSASLAAWAGRRVRVRLRVEGDGVGLFGNPIVSVPATSARSPDVVVYLIDTLRGDHLGASGPDRPPVSPVLDRLAREGVWFRRAQSSSPWTKPAVATLMSGILPTTHRVGARAYTDRMPETVPLLQERFRAAGWRTGSFSASPLGSTLSALERGFDAAYPPRFWRGRAQLGMNPTASQLHEALLDWIDEQPDRPVFAYLHTLEVHEWKLARYQNEKPPGFSAYDAAILDADRQLGNLLEALDARRTARGGRELLLVVVSDHGESWGDHGLPSHGFGLYQSQVHIPLIFWRSGAGLPPRAIDTPVSLADLGPSLVEGFGLAALEEADGRSLAPALDGADLDRGPVLSALLRFVWAPRAPRQWALTTPDRRVRIRNEAGPDRSFDLVVDPDELRPLPEPSDALDATLDALLAEQAERAARFEARHGAVAPGPVTADETARLRALGYLDDGDPGEAEEPPPNPHVP